MKPDTPGDDPPRPAPERRQVRAAGARLTVFADAPSWNGSRTAALGEIAFDSAEAGAACLASACSELVAEGVEAVVGPMDGDTWHAYRLVTESDGSPAFLMEPADSPAARGAFAMAGFTPIARYVSARAPLPQAIGPDPEGPAPDIAGWDGRPELFAEIHALSRRTFVRNPFYRPLSQAAFLDLYRPVLGLLDPELILTARDPATGVLVGYLFGIPDHANPASRTAILKTYASARRGVGHHLAHAFHSRAAARGFTHVIHALMHESNLSRARSEAHGGRVFRRYALMGWRPEPGSEPPRREEGVSAR